MIYLASQSARRKEILKKMKIPFRVVPSAYREYFRKDLSPLELTLKHALGKALKAELPRGARYVLAADTVVWRKKFHGKPKSFSQALQMIKSLSGRSHDVCTGVVLWDRKRGEFFQGVSKTKVFFKKMSDSEIRKYLSVVCPFDKAGSYAIQEGPKIVKSIRGSYSNVVGLPKGLVRMLLKKCRKSPMINKRGSSCQKRKTCGNH